MRSSRRPEILLRFLLNYGLNKRAPGTWSRAESRIERKIEAVPLVELANLGNV